MHYAIHLRRILASGIAVGAMACSGSNTGTSTDSPPYDTHHALVRGVVTDPAGRPIQGVEVMVRTAAPVSAPGKVYGIPNRYAVTNVTGGYAIDAQFSVGDPARPQDSVFVVGVTAYALDPRFPRRADNFPFNDSVKVTVQVVPRPQPPREFNASPIVLRIP